MVNAMSSLGLHEKYSRHENTGQTTQQSLNSTYKSATITPIFILIDFRSLALQSPQ